ncbi:MAG: hypothetical protein HZB53_20225 [Chloroflexi bacterium]|nr:hypothetical protein [Chloroflexota bacterium]
MPRSIRRGLIATSLSLSLGVLGLMLWVLAAAGVFAAAGSAPAALGTNGLRYCTGWEFLNNTSQDVNGLRFRLSGIPTVTSVYTEVYNPFGPTDGSSGYDAGANAYRLNFSGATVDASGMVHVGFCSDSPGLLLDPQAAQPLMWTLTGTQVLSNPLFAGVAWDWPSPPHLRVRVVNAQNISMTLVSVNLLDPGTALALDDLTADGTATAMPVLEMLDAPRDVGPLADSFFDVFFDLSSGATPPDHAQRLEVNHPYILDIVMESIDDPGNGVHVYAQGLSPPVQLYLPAVAR